MSEQVPKEEQQVQNIQEDLKSFKITEILNKNIDNKSIIFLGKFEKDKENEKQAILLLNKSSFPEKTDNIPSIVESNQYFHNDIFRRFETIFSKEFNNIDMQIIYPATEKFIKKYRQGKVEVFEETPQIYEQLTKPYIKQDSEKSLQWVYNILEGKSEQDKVIYKDEDPETGFLLVPDYQFSDSSNLESLHILALSNRRNIQSLRDLGQKELPLLEKIYSKGIESIEQKYKVPKNQIRVFVHYQPTFYHFHVHFVNIAKFNASMAADRAHLLPNVIQNIKLVPEYYQKVTMSYILSEQQVLYQILKENLKEEPYKQQKTEEKNEN